MKNKKVLLSILPLMMASALALSGCAPSTTSSLPSNNETLTQTEEVGPNAESVEEESFKDGVLTTEDFTIEITGTEVIAKGVGANKYGDGPILAIFFDITNNGETADVSPADWAMTFTAVQDNDPNKINELDYASYVGETFGDSFAKIKPGGTVQSVYAYKLTDTTTPVELTASPLFSTDNFGTLVIELN